MVLISKMWKEQVSAAEVISNFSLLFKTTCDTGAELSCRMLHVLILSLLRKINASSRERLLDLVLKWRQSAPTVLATWRGGGLGLVTIWIEIK